MSVEILPAARERLIGIWQYSAETWGDEQADKYVADLVAHARALASRKSLWRSLREPGFHGVFPPRTAPMYSAGFMSCSAAAAV